MEQTGHFYNSRDCSATDSHETYSAQLDIFRDYVVPEIKSQVGNPTESVAESQSFPSKGTNVYSLTYPPLKSKLGEYDIQVKIVPEAIILVSQPTPGILIPQDHQRCALFASYSST